MHLENAFIQTNFCCIEGIAYILLIHASHEDQTNNLANNILVFTLEFNKQLQKFTI